MFLRLTANHRLADYLRQEKSEAGVFQIDDYFSQEYRALAERDPRLPTLMSKEVEALLWERAVRDTLGESLLKPQALVSLAKEAWTFLHQWRLPLAFEIKGREEGSIFLNWCKVYQASCDEARIMDEARLPDAFSRALTQKLYKPPATIDCVGFEEYSPQLKHFLETSADLGTKVLLTHLVPFQNHPSSVSVIKASHPEEELVWAFDFARYHHLRFPGSRICIVVPDLVLKRNSVARLAKSYFKAGDYNISAPLPLSHYPLIEAAFLGLTLLKDEFEFKEFSQFLRSPFFSQTEEDKLFKAELEARMRSFVGLNLTLSHCRQLIERLNKKLMPLDAGPLLLQVNQLLSLSAQSFGAKKLSSDWAHIFIKVLEILGFAGGTLSASDNLLKAKWQEILDCYSKMSAILGPHTFKDALERLAVLRDSQTFLPPSSQTASVHILGLLEAVGIPFDAIWVTGLHSENWPGKHHPHPLIPLSLQKTHDLPHSTPSRELAVARRLTNRLKWGGKTVVFSYPSQIEEQICEVSPILANLERIEPLALSRHALSDHALSSHQSSAKIVGSDRLSSHQSSAKIVGADLPVGPLPPTPAMPTPTRLKGGAFTLKLQAACPFKAFATIRLQALALVLPTTAFRKTERGDLIHETLNKIWGSLKTQEALLKLNTLQLDTLVEQTIHSVLTKWQHSTRRFSSFYLALEHKRMVNLIKAFLVIEKARPAFEVVDQEYEETVLLASLAVKLRIDRIDRLSTGEEIIIDYKTGEAPISQWFGTRLLDPQLPLYAITRPNRPDAIAFAHISAKKLGFQGAVLSTSTPLLKGLYPIASLARFGAEANTLKQFEAWEESVKTLAEGFKTSYATLDPVKGETTCRACHLKPLCRIKTHPCKTI